MRKTGLTLLAIGALLGATSLAAGPALAGTSLERTTAAKDAARWLADQADDDGLIGTDFGLATSAQAVVAFVAAGVGGDEVTTILAELGNRVDEVVKTAAGDDPGALAYLILAAEAAGRDPQHFGVPETNLVQRLVDLEGDLEPGLFGSFDPTYDGATRQGLALMALDAAGIAPDAAAIDWLVDQQCTDADFAGYWMGFRADTTVDCVITGSPAFTGPDSNSTAVAMLGLIVTDSAPDAVDDAVAALTAKRNDDGGFSFSPTDTVSDASSTGLVAEAFQARTGTSDSEAVAALLGLQSKCGAVDDDGVSIAGGVTFLPGGEPDALSTIQAIPALSGSTRPIGITGVPTGAFNEICGVANSTTTSSTTVTSSSTATSATTATTGGGSIPNTGANSRSMALFGLAFVGLGLVAIGRSRLQSR